VWYKKHEIKKLQDQKIVKVFETEETSTEGKRKLHQVIFDNKQWMFECRDYILVLRGDKME
jgi:hypothetical protein